MDKVTSSGIIRNAEKPRVGVISQHSVCPDLLDDIITQGINLSWDSYVEDLTNELRLQEKTEEEINESLEEANISYDNSGDTYLYGDWVKNKQGKYKIDKNGKHGFALSFSSEGNVCVEWSKHTKRCNHTSPCYVMADGSGPCGDLNTAGDSVVAYCLPDDCLNNEK